MLIHQRVAPWGVKFYPCEQLDSWALSGFDFRLSAQDESDRNHAKTKNNGIEYPERKIVATRVAIIVQCEILDPKNEKTSNNGDDYAQFEQFGGERQGRGQFWSFPMSVLLT